VKSDSGERKAESRDGLTIETGDTTLSQWSPTTRISLSTIINLNHRNQGFGLGMWFIALGVFFLVVKPDTDFEGFPSYFVGLFFVILGVVFFAPYILAPFFPKKPWAWIYGIVMICIGMTSACTLPASIALLIFWLKPETKQYFGRTG